MRPTRWLGATCAALLVAFCDGDARASASGNGAQPGKPLVVNPYDRVVALEYEAWFGPHAVTFQNAEAMPWLQSADMQPVGGGYDSADPHVIAQHLAWMQYMGIDAVTLDLTNNVGCIFSTGPVSPKYCSPATEAFRQNNRAIRANVANLYPAWTGLRTPVKIMPLLGCQTWKDVRPGGDGRSGFEDEIEWFGGLMTSYPGLSVDYEHHPLLLIYTGTPVDPALLSSCHGIIHRSGLDALFTFRFVAGYLESQPTFWNDPGKQPTGPIEISPQYQFWSVVDRYKPAYGYYPTYSVVPGDPAQAENLTVSLATAGQTGWGCPEPIYCLDAALRYGETGSRYITLQRFMVIAAHLRPTFLIVDQFNEFAQPDEGWNAQTSDDAEPTRLPSGWALGAVKAIHDAIESYREQRAPRD